MTTRPSLSHLNPLIPHLFTIPSLSLRRRPSAAFPLLLCTFLSHHHRYRRRHRRPHKHPKSPIYTTTLKEKIKKSMRRPGVSSTARVYTDVNVVEGKEYSDYEALDVHCGEQDDYKVLWKVGRGKYNEVSEAVRSIALFLLAWGGGWG
ncbi:hypothetical protein Droror1_Dr00017293 [Drosera rotundifolia]